MKTEIVGFRLNERLRDKLDVMSTNLGNDRSKQLTKLVEQAVNDYDASEDFAKSVISAAKEVFKHEDKLEMLEFSKELSYAKSIIGHNHPLHRDLTLMKKQIDNKVIS